MERERDYVEDMGCAQTDCFYNEVGARPHSSVRSIVRSVHPLTSACFRALPRLTDRARRRGVDGGTAARRGGDLLSREFDPRRGVCSACARRLSRGLPPARRAATSRALPRLHARGHGGARLRADRATSQLMAAYKPAHPVERASEGRGRTPQARGDRDARDDGSRGCPASRLVGSDRDGRGRARVT